MTSFAAICASCAVSVYAYQQVSLPSHLRTRTHFFVKKDRVVTALRVCLLGWQHKVDEEFVQLVDWFSFRASVAALMGALGMFYYSAIHQRVTADLDNDSTISVAEADEYLDEQRPAKRRASGTW